MAGRPEDIGYGPFLEKAIDRAFLSLTPVAFRLLYLALQLLFHCFISKHLRLRRIQLSKSLKTVGVSTCQEYPTQPFM
jgi:hypothetical protein